MIKYVIVVLNALVVFVFSWLSGNNGVTLTGNFPKTMNAGTEVPIELTIKKGDLGGFAKLQLELPEGILIKELDNKGATFSYVSGLAKWIWTALPADADMVVKCTLVADANATGNKAIGGKFSFVENNAKQISEMPPVEIQLTSNNSNSSEANSTASTKAITSNAENSTPTTNEPKTMAGGEPLGNVYATRKVTSLSSNEFQIDIKIKKDGTKGFAKYNDNLPEGFTARQSKTDGASFSVADNKIKFVWVSVPPTEELTISYLLKGSNTKPEELVGEYSYLEDNQSKKVKVLPDLLPATPEITATAPEKNTNTFATTEPKANEPASANTTPPTMAGKEPKENPSNTNAPANQTETTLADNLAKKEGKVNYAVQVGAFVNGNINAEVLAKKFNLSANIRSEMKDGFHKFLIGSHREYQQARDQREVIKTNNGINGAFVVAYNNGQRITVQEALTISSQKWFK